MKFLYHYYFDDNTPDLKPKGENCVDDRIEEYQKAMQEFYKKMYSAYEDGFLNILDDYISYWSDKNVQEFHYDISPLDVLKAVKKTVKTGIYDEEMEYFFKSKLSNEE